jgi:21S rRNA (GM2251-2'-O)-methyltransferase
MNSDRYRYTRDGDDSGAYGYTENREPPCGRYDGDHLYGISPIRTAIAAGRRNITELLVQEGMELSNKKDEKAASDILKIAKAKGITVREFPKHDLNMLTENRPHQGFVLRAAPLQFQRVDGLPPSPTFQCVLALDEVWDPQNFGALLRTSHFLGVDRVVVCAKNSAPLSPSVSKASSGALELMDVGSTDNMMRFLDKSMENGWQVVGTALGDAAVSLEQLPLRQPTVLVLGNEGHGIRTNILRRCTHLVKIPSAGAGAAAGDGFGVDSLNVSVTGGIMLHHILAKGRAAPVP